MFDAVLFDPLTNILAFFLQFTDNLGIAIIGMTLLIRGALLPLTRPAAQTTEKMKDVQKELEKFKKKYKDDKKKLQEAQLKLYKEHGINPAAGCLPQIVQLVVLIGLFRVLINLLSPETNAVALINDRAYFSFLHLPESAVLNAKFLYLDLSRPDFISLPWSVQIGPVTIDRLPGFFLIAAAVFQFFSSKMMLPGVQSEEKAAKETEKKSDDFATMMQEQMLYMFPLMTLLIGLRFPSGIVLYWITFSIFMMVDQYRRNGKKDAEVAGGKRNQLLNR